MSDVESRSGSPVPEEEVEDVEVEETPADEAEESGQEPSDDDGDDGDEDDASESESKQDEISSEFTKMPVDYTKEQLKGNIGQYIKSQLLANKPNKAWRLTNYAFMNEIISGYELSQHENIEGDFIALISIEQWNPLNQWASAKKDGKGSADQKTGPKKAWTEIARSTVKVASLQKVGITNQLASTKQNPALLEGNPDVFNGPAYYQAKFIPMPEKSEEDGEEEDDDEDEDEESSPAKPSKPSAKKNVPIEGVKLPEKGRVSIHIYKLVEEEEKEKKESIMNTQVRFNSATLSGKGKSVIGQTTLQVPQFSLNSTEEEDEEQTANVLKTIFHSLFHLPIQIKGGKTVIVGDITAAQCFFTVSLEGAKGSAQQCRIPTHTFVQDTAHPFKNSLPNFISYALKGAAAAVQPGQPKKKSKGPANQEGPKLSDWQLSLNRTEEQVLRARGLPFRFFTILQGTELSNEAKRAFKVATGTTQYEQLAPAARKTLEQANVAAYDFRTAKNEWENLEDWERDQILQYLDGRQGQNGQSSFRPGGYLQTSSDHDLMVELARRQQMFGGAPGFGGYHQPQMPMPVPVAQPVTYTPNYYANVSNMPIRPPRRTQSFGLDQPAPNFQRPQQRRNRSTSSNRLRHTQDWASTDM